MTISPSMGTKGK